MKGQVGRALSMITPVVKEFKNLYTRGVGPSTSTISNSTNFQKVLLKVVLVGDLISKFIIVELTVCTLQTHSL